jgi:hypothetical protein
MPPPRVDAGATSVYWGYRLVSIVEEHEEAAEGNPSCNASQEKHDPAEQSRNTVP